MTPALKPVLRIVLCVLFGCIGPAVFSQQFRKLINLHSVPANNNRTVSPNFPAARIVRFSSNVLSTSYRSQPDSSAFLIDWSIDDDIDWYIAVKPAVVTTTGLNVSGIPAARSSALSFPTLLNGTLQNGKGQVRLAVSTDFVYGFIDDGTNRYFIEPLKKFDSTASADQYIVYDSKTSAPLNNFCGTPDIERPAKTADPVTGPAAVTTRQICKQLRIAIAADYSVYERHKSVQTVINYTLANWNIVQSYYTGFDLDNESATDVGDDDIHFIITNLYISTDKNNDVVPDDGITIKRFLNWGATHFSAPFDIAELITNRNIPAPIPNVAGIAVLPSSLCGIYAHIVEDYSGNAHQYSLIAAHEMGHNLGCWHDTDVHSSVRSFIMNASVNSATRFSVNTDFPADYPLSSKQFVKDLFIRSTSCNPGGACAINSCANIEGLEIERLDVSRVRLHWKPGAQEYVVQYKAAGDSAYAVANIFTVSTNDITITGLEACRKYDFMVKSKCAAASESLPVTISYQASSFLVEAVSLKNINSRRYDLHFTLRYLNGTAGGLPVEVSAGGVSQSLTFSGTKQDIVLPGIFQDGQLLKHLKVKVAGYEDCNTSIPYKVPAYGDANCQVLFKADFNDSITPAGWSNKLIRKYFSNVRTGLEIGPGNFTRNTSLSVFPYGNFDGSSMAYYDYYNNGHISQFGAYELKSPVVDISGKTNVTLSFDYAYYSHTARRPGRLAFMRVEVFDGAKWVKVFMVDSSAQYVNYCRMEDFWTSVPPRVYVNVDQYRNPSFQARFIIDDATEMFRPEWGMLTGAWDNISLCASAICTEAAIKPLPSQTGTPHDKQGAVFCTDADYFTHCTASGDSLLLSFRKSLTDPVQLHPGRVMMQFFSASLPVNASQAPYIKDQQRWLLFNRYWQISTAVPFSDSCTIRLYFTQAELDAIGKVAGGPIPVAAVRPYYLVNNNPVFSVPVHQSLTENDVVLPVAHIAGNGKYYVVEFNAKAPGIIGLGILLPAPDPAIQLSGVVKADKVSLQWKVTDEKNVEKYVIERSADGIAFSTIGTVTGTGSGNYAFDDGQPLAGMNHYRVYLVDKQGRHIFSRILFLRYSKGRVQSVFAYPNPVDDKLKLEINTQQAGILTIEFMNATGQLVAKQVLPVNAGFNTKAIPVKWLASGIYMLRCQLGNKIEYIRVLKL